MNFDQRNRVLNAQHDVAIVLNELRQTPDYDGAGMNDLDKAIYHLSKALEKARKSSRD